jgi:hypothetical protein
VTGDALRILGSIRRPSGTSSEIGIEGEMGKQLTPLSRTLGEALEVATLSLSDLAAGLRISSSALRRYRLRNRTPKPGQVRRIASALRSRARRLEVLANRLESFTNAETGEDNE